MAFYADFLFRLALQRRRHRAHHGNLRLETEAHDAADSRLEVHLEPSRLSIAALEVEEVAAEVDHGVVEVVVDGVDVGLSNDFSAPAEQLATLDFLEPFDALGGLGGQVLMVSREQASLGVDELFPMRVQAVGRTKKGRHASNGRRAHARIASPFVTRSGGPRDP